MCSSDLVFRCPTGKEAAGPRYGQPNYFFPTGYYIYSGGGASALGITDGCPDKDWYGGTLVIHYLGHIRLRLANIAWAERYPMVFDFVYEGSGNYGPGTPPLGAFLANHDSSRGWDGMNIVHLDGHAAWRSGNLSRNALGAAGDIANYEGYQTQGSSWGWVWHPQLSCKRNYNDCGWIKNDGTNPGLYQVPPWYSF